MHVVASTCLFLLQMIYIAEIMAKQLSPINDHIISCFVEAITLFKPHEVIMQEGRNCLYGTSLLLIKGAYCKSEVFV